MTEAVPHHDGEFTPNAILVVGIKFSWSVAHNAALVSGLEDPVEDVKVDLPLVHISQIGAGIVSGAVVDTVVVVILDSVLL